jgi:hypothetical protein
MPRESGKSKFVWLGLLFLSPFMLMYVWLEVDSLLHPVSGSMLHTWYYPSGSYVTSPYLRSVLVVFGALAVLGAGLWYLARKWWRK